MKTKKITLLTFIVMTLIMSCTKQPYYEIPTDANGKVVITGVSKTTSDGITALDDHFTVNAYLPNAKAGDVMTAELLKPQLPPWDPNATATQILPIDGTKKQVTVNADLKISVSYTRTEAQLTNVGDYVTVTLSGATESGIISIKLASAFSVTKPKFNGVEVPIIRTPEVAYIEANVTPKTAAYTGDLIVKRKNGSNGSWVNIGTGTLSIPQPYQIPVSGADFVSDTMFYSFTATSGAYSEEYTTKIIVNDPFFFIQKKGVTLTVGGSSAGRNLLINAAVAEDDANAILAVSGTSVLQLAGGSVWATDANHSIEFVPSTLAKYNANNSSDAKADFAAGTPVSTVDPATGEGVFIYKIVNGTNPEDVYYGMLKVTDVSPGASVTIDYRIGDQYAHLSVVR